jgi:hypothetical protein
MPNSDSITFWLEQFKVGNADAARPLWERYFHRLVGLAGKRLGSCPTAARGPEDVALSAFGSFLAGAREGRFERLNDRNDLWQILSMLTVRKVADLIKHEMAAKRGGGKIRSASAASADSDESDLLAQVVGREPTPELTAQVAEEWERLLKLLPDDTARAVALARMEGFSNQEIADQVRLSVGTVERKRKLIRDIWENELAH